MTGRRIEGLCVQSVHEDCQYELPITIECDDIPNERSEIPTPDVARFHYHLKTQSYPYSIVSVYHGT